MVLTRPHATVAAQENHLELLKVAKGFATDHLGLAYPSGVHVWSGMKNIPSVVNGGMGLVLLWPRYNSKEVISHTIHDTSRS